MTRSTHPFPLPTKPPQVFSRVQDYWERLKRGDNDIPFWDDVNLSALPDVSDRLMLVDAFENPQRFRLNTLGQKLQHQYGTNVTGKFVDEIEPKAPFEFLTAQASATVEAKTPTFISLKSPAGANRNEYGRLLLPMWGNGRIDIILGLIAPS